MSLDDPEPGPDAAGENPISRILRRLPFLGERTAERLEHDWARRECGELVELLRGIQGRHAGLAGEALYERVVAARLECDLPTARQVVRIADQSFAQWPRERDVNFRDVVNVLLMNRILGARPGVMGAHPGLARVVETSIPAEL